MENTYKHEVHKRSNYLKVLSVIFFISTLLMYAFGGGLFENPFYMPLYLCFLLYGLTILFFCLYLKFNKNYSTFKATILFIALLLFLPVFNLIMVYLFLAIFPILFNLFS